MKHRSSAFFQRATRKSKGMLRSKLAAAIVFSTVVVGSPVSAADLSNLLSILDTTDDGAWAKVSLNPFSAAWPDPDDRALAGSSWSNPNAVVLAWSSFAWDSTRGDLLIFGGGHANYAGNEVYRWSGTTQLWELASLPSNVSPHTTALGPIYIPVDGAINAPTSIHTYDNNEYLPVADRFISLGGAAFNTGGMQQIENPDGTFRPTGPYLWDPSKSDPSKVGGTTGSAVDPAVVGGQMWQNRDVRNLFQIQASAGSLPVGNTDGTTAVVVEDGKDVVYFTGPIGRGTDKFLLKYTITDVNDPSLDTVAVVGGWLGGPQAYGAGAIDPESGFYVALGGTSAQPFVAWDVDAPGGTSNFSSLLSVAFSGASSFSGTAISGIDWDPVTDAFWVWSGGGDVWKLEAPSSGVLSDQWTFTLVTNASSLPLGEMPDNASPAGGVRGKWKYIPNLHAFMALEANPDGEVWLYRPEGWVNPVPEPGTYALIFTGLGMVWWSLMRRRRLS